MALMFRKPVTDYRTPENIEEDIMLDIKNRVLEVISEVGSIDFDVLEDEELSLVKNLGLDSLELVEIVMGLEEEFDIEIPDEDAEKLTTIEDVIRYIEEQI